jgi:5S rRNA maturation endonuclease (ribonuclease M5)
VKLTRIEVKNYRSLFADSPDDSFVLDLADGMNALIGPNNCGKSNLLRAVALALDPNFPFDRALDMPGSMQYAFPRVTLDFECDGRTSMEGTLLKYLEEYERQFIAAGKRTYAQEGLIRYTVSFPGNERSGANRQVSFVARGAGARRGERESLVKPLAQFRKALQFVLISSGESLESLLAGKFREILHTVIQEHLKDKFATADRRRSGYVEHLQGELLSPLQDKVGDVVADLFPEITAVTLVPQVPSIDDTLSHVSVFVTDAVETSLAAKGTGVRGAVLVAMLRYLADWSRRSMVFAVEEPEAFLHPKAQEDIRDDLEALAERRDVTLLVTTHSPFTVSRDPKAKVISLTKDAGGRTIVVGEAGGAQSHASLLGGLFKDAALPDLLERVAQIPSKAKGVVVVEGTTDEAYLRLAAKIAGRPDLVDDLYITPAGNAERVVVQSVLLQRQTARPLLALLDNDQPGRDAMRALTGRFKFQNKKEVLTVVEGLPGVSADFPAEAEDLFPSALMQRFVDEEGEETVLAAKQKRPDGQWHYDFTATGKDLIIDFLEHTATPKDVKLWVELLDLIRKRMGLA